MAPAQLSLRSTMSFALVAGLITSSPSLARDMWKDLGGHCDDAVWPNAETVPLQELDKCTRLWFAYRQVDGLDQAYRAQVSRAMLQLYAAGTDAQAHLVLQTVSQFEIQSLPDRRPLLTSGQTGAALKREPCNVPPPSKRSIKEAKAELKRGVKLAKLGDYGEALTHFSAMVDVAPGWPASHYNVAAMHARLDNEDLMTQHLFCLQDIGSEDSARLLAKARTDNDFRSLRDTAPGFKLVTGYAKVKLGNSLGERGEDNVDNIEASLNALGFNVGAVKPTSRLYSAPRIWYRPEARIAAYIALKVIDHPKTTASPIDWDERDYDVIIAWGDNLKKNEEPPLYVNHPDDAEDRMRELRTAQNDILRKPDKAVDNVNKVLGTPGKVVDNVEGAINRTERTLDKIQKIPNAIPGL